MRRVENKTLHIILKNIKILLKIFQVSKHASSKKKNLKLFETYFQKLILDNSFKKYFQIDHEISFQNDFN